MKTTYFTILMKHLEHMQIEVSAASESEMGAVPLNLRELVYDCNRFLFIRSGTGTLWVRGREEELAPGTLCVLLAGTPHRIAVDPGEILNVQWCHFHTNYADRDIYRTLQLPVAIRVEDRTAVSSLFEALMDAVTQNKFTSKLRIKAVVLQLISIYLEQIPEEVRSEAPTQELEKIDTILQYIDDHLADNVTVDDLARQVYLHPNYFIVFFKSLVGCSPIQYVNQRRMETAKTLLSKPGSNVSDVASQVGMQIYYFSRMFKAHTGLTPSRFRKQSADIASAAEPAEQGGSL